jgi:hypothetical protein
MSDHNMFGKRGIAKDYAGIIAQIRDGEPRVPQHRQPKTIRDNGFESFVTAAHEVLFDDFLWFGAVLNRHTSVPWSIEELPDTHVRLPGDDGPSLGRRYRVFFNACEMGTIEVTVGGYAELYSGERLAKEMCAAVYLDLHYLRFVPYLEAHSLVRAISLFIGRFVEREAANASASADATAALTQYLWDTVRCEETVLGFDYKIEGPYELLRLTSEHWIANGFDPFKC